MKRANFPGRKFNRQLAAMNRFKAVPAGHRSSEQKAVEFAALTAAILAGPPL